MSVVAAVKLSVVLVAPLMGLKLAPMSVDTYHCTVGVGVPEAAALKLTVAPLLTLTLAGLVVTWGPVSTMSTAAPLVTVPTELVKTASYSLPLSEEVVVMARVSDVAPGTGDQLVPPLVDTCHCTVGLGLPLAVAVKVAEAPAITCWSDGLDKIAGPLSTVNVAAAVVTVPTEFAKTASY